MFGFYVKPTSELVYDETSKTEGNITRRVQRDGEFRLQHGNGYESLLMIEDEVVLNADNKMVAVKTDLGHFYLVV